MKTEDEYILLTRGTLRGWHTTNDEVKKLLQSYLDVDPLLPAPKRKNAIKQRVILCQIIDAFDGKIRFLWDGDMFVFSKDEAKEYVLGIDKP